MSYTTSQIRNMALAGHPGTGKTTLFEALLHAGGAIQTAGTIERGTTVSDFDPMEKARGHSLNTVLASTDHASVHLNIFDTPGYPDFRGPTFSAFSAVETVCIVVNASNGIEYGTRRMMEVAKTRNLSRVLVINKIDADPGKLNKLVEQIR
ncbi:MAG: GTP-binding protein, partial [Arenimonas sp.]